MSNRAAIYCRSSKDRSDVSIDAQRRALHDLATTRNLIVVDEFSDAVESGKDDDRPAFQRLLRSLRNAARGWSWVLALDTSRVARRRTLALFFEQECAKHKVKVVYRSVPDTDPITEMLLKSILQAMDEWHSLTSKAKGLAGMAENVRQGWRAGGRAPRGYRLEHAATGAVRDGSPVMKARLVLDEADAPAVREYLALRAGGLPRSEAIRRAGVRWPANSTHSMDWQALTYAGHTVWFMHSERGSPEKRRPRNEWVIKRDTHEAMITDAQAEAILAQQERSQSGRRNRDTPRILSGLLAAPNGQRWHSDGAGAYRLGKGARIAASLIEPAVLERIQRDLQSQETVDLLRRHIQAIYEEPLDARRRAGMEKRATGLAERIGRAVDLAGQADDPAPYLRHVADLEGQRAALMDEIDAQRQAEQRRQTAAGITDDHVRAMLARMFSETLTADPAAVRLVLADLVSAIVLDPATMQAEIQYALTLQTGDSVASRRGFELSPAIFRSLVAIPHRSRSTTVRCGAIYIGEESTRRARIK